MVYFRCAITTPNSPGAKYRENLRRNWRWIIPRARGELCLMFVQKPYNLSKNASLTPSEVGSRNWWWIMRLSLKINEQNTCKQLDVILKRLIIIKALFACDMRHLLAGIPWKVGKLIYIKLNYLLIDLPKRLRCDRWWSRKECVLHLAADFCSHMIKADFFPSSSPRLVFDYFR